MLAQKRIFSLLAVIFVLFTYTFALAEERKININTADKHLLQTLNGIGEKKAAAIISYREEHKGGFTDIEEIKEVPGIGEKIFQSIKDRITVSDETPETETTKEDKKKTQTDNQRNTKTPPEKNP